jgi:hypothetical protein
MTFGTKSTFLFDDKPAGDLVEAGEWSWHDTPASWLDDDVKLPPGCMIVLAFNGKSAKWGTGTEHSLRLGSDKAAEPFRIDSPDAWLSAVTFLSVDADGRPANSVFPNRIVVHVENTADRRLTIKTLRLWLPPTGATHHVFEPALEWNELKKYPSDGVIAGPGRAVVVIDCKPLPLGYAVVEVVASNDGQSDVSLWGQLRVKRDVFDISGGWVASDIGGRNTLTIQEYLKTLRRMHINTGQIEEVAGYTDNPELYERFPLKRFNRLQDLRRYDTDDMLPTIHAVEFIGEPQYGGGRPIAPQEVWRLLAPYQPSRLPTSVTLSEERAWRYYAGLSDFPHYDAYRVMAPAADSWRSYDRWEGQRIRWGAPLETIGAMTRSLRELSRPRPIAYWSQGAYAGWGGRFSPRRGSPTPEELRAQAWHGLANRVTSLYWFNLSLQSLLKYPDLIDPITRVNREIRLVDNILLEGDAFEYRRAEKDGLPDWDFNSVAGPRTALLVAHDISYQPDPNENVFRFTARACDAEFQIPPWFDQPLDVFSLDADGTKEVQFTIHDGRVKIKDDIYVVGIYVITIDKALRQEIDRELSQLINLEQSLDFDPANNPSDLARLQSILAEVR